MSNVMTRTGLLQAYRSIGFLAFGLIPAPLLAQGTAQSWGLDESNQVSNTPSAAHYVQVESGYDHSVALAASGSIHSWGVEGGFFDVGQVSNTPGGSNYIQVTAGSAHSVALRSDGSLVDWGSSTATLTTPTGTGFIQVSGGGLHSVALRADGSIVSWGTDFHGEVSNTPTTTGFVQVAAGSDHSLALRADGSILSWGANGSNVVADTPTGTGFTQVSAGWNYSLALRADGSIAAWGRDVDGQVTSAPSGTGFLQVSAGDRHGLALAADGSIAAWGSDSAGQVSGAPSGTGYTQVAGGIHHSSALLGENPGNGFCYGDGSGGTCPCAAYGNPGQGCANSGGSGGATLTGHGVARLSVDNLRLEITRVPGNKVGLIFRGANQINGGLGLPVGDGLLCTSGQVARSHLMTTFYGGVTFTNFNGESFGATSLGVGVPTNYQFWYRDPQNVCSGARFNYTNAWTTTWMP